MARPWRIQFEDACYHATSRGNHRQKIFFAEDDRAEFLNLLGEAKARFNLKVFAFCLMTNHYHLLISTPDANLSKTMQWLNTTYSARVQRRQKISGHLFQGRFKAVLLEDEYHWQRLSYYIHLNPVRAKMVESPAQYQWSSFSDYIRVKSRFEWLSRREILEADGLKGAASRRAYRDNCLTMANRPKEFWKDVTGKAIIGSEEFVEKIKKTLAPTGIKKQEVVDYTRLARDGQDMEQQLQKVAKVFDTDPDKLKQRSKYFPARQAAFLHLVENCGIRPGKVAEYFKISSGAITNGIDRLKVQAAENSDLDRKIRLLGQGG